jgi:hypothetical protein
MNESGYGMELHHWSLKRKDIVGKARDEVDRAYRMFFRSRGMVPPLVHCDRLEGDLNEFQRWLMKDTGKWTDRPATQHKPQEQK